MILKNRKKAVGYKLLAASSQQSKIGNLKSAISSIRLLATCFLVLATCSFATCKYGFKDVSLEA